MNLLVWSERLSYQELAAPAALDLLRRHAVTLGVLVTPAHRARDGEALLALIRRATEVGVPMALWPRLSDDDPRPGGGVAGLDAGAGCPRSLDRR